MKALRAIFIVMLCLAMSSCEQASHQPETSSSEGTYVLNSGNWGANDANVGIYDPASRTYTPDVFFTVNGQPLGDTGQDIIRCGDDVYIAVNVSQTVFVTDASLEIKEQVNAVGGNGERLSPKILAIAGNDVYVTYYEGYVGRISSAGHSVDLCPVGPNPEGLAVAGGNLYVANSGGMLSATGYNNTVSVVSLDSFTEISTIEVNVNPMRVEASSDGEYVYVSSYGNYFDIPAGLQVISTSTGNVADLDYSSVSSIAGGKDDILYVLCSGYDENWNPLPGMVYMHDMKKNEPLGTFVTDGTTLPEAYSISAAADGYVYVGCSDYTTTGDVYVFTPDGRLYDRFDSAGLNPQKVR